MEEESQDGLDAQVCPVTPALAVHALPKKRSSALLLWGMGQCWTAQCNCVLTGETTKRPPLADVSPITSRQTSTQNLFKAFGKIIIIIISILRHKHLRLFNHSYSKARNAPCLYASLNFKHTWCHFSLQKKFQTSIFSTKDEQFYCCMSMSTKMQISRSNMQYALCSIWNLSILILSWVCSNAWMALGVLSCKDYHHEGHHPTFTLQHHHLPHHKDHHPHHHLPHHHQQIGRLGS